MTCSVAPDKIKLKRPLVGESNVRQMVQMTCCPVCGSTAPFHTIPCHTWQYSPHPTLHCTFPYHTWQYPPHPTLLFHQSPVCGRRCTCSTTCTTPPACSLAQPRYIKFSNLLRLDLTCGRSLAQPCYIKFPNLLRLDIVVASPAVHQAHTCMLPQPCLSKLFLLNHLIAGG